MFHVRFRNISVDLISCCGIRAWITQNLDFLSCVKKYGIIFCTEIGVKCCTSGEGKIMLGNVDSQDKNCLLNVHFVSKLSSSDMEQFLIVSQDRMIVFWRGN